MIFFDDLHQIWVIFPLGWVWKLKNHQQLTFGILKSNWAVVQHSHLFLRIDMIPKKLANIHVTCWRPKETFLTALRAKRHDPPQREKWLNFDANHRRKPWILPRFELLMAFTGRRTHFYALKGIGGCSGTSSWPWNVLVWVETKYFALVLKKMLKKSPPKNGSEGLLNSERRLW